MNEKIEINKSQLENLTAHRYELMAGALIDTAKELDLPSKVDMMRQFVDSVKADAIEGKITKNGVAYSSEQIQSRLDGLNSGLADPNHEVRQKSLQDIPRAGGLRIAFNAFLTNEVTAQALVDALKPIEVKATEQEPAPEAVRRELGQDAIESSYDHLFDADYQMPTSTEAAAIRPVETEGDRLARARHEADNKAWNKNIIEDQADRFRKR